VLITAYQMTPEYRAEMLDIGFLYVLQKPVENKELQAVVHRAHGHWKMKQDLKRCNGKVRSYSPDSLRKLQEAAASFHASAAKMLTL